MPSESADDLLLWLQSWYSSNCNGDWEHQQGVKIDTLDNPGWLVDIDLIGTPLETKKLEEVKVDLGDNDWFLCDIRKNKFTGRGDPQKLKVILKVFKDWVES